jgi:hypothetical protein
MTLATTPPLIDYVENGVTLVHAIPFQFQARARSSARGSRAASRRCSRSGADYTVAGGGGGTGTSPRPAAA